VRGCDQGSHPSLRGVNGSFIGPEGGFGRFELRLRYGPTALVKLAHTLERRLRSGHFCLSSVELGLSADVVVAQVSQFGDIKDHAIGADLILIGRRSQLNCFDTVALLSLGIKPDNQLAVVRRNPNGCLDWLLTLGFSTCLDPAGNEAPHKQTADTEDNHYGKKDPPKPAQHWRLFASSHSTLLIALDALSDRWL